MFLRNIALALFFIVPTAAVAQTCTWGCFDASRVNYTGGVLTTGSHTQLRTIITANGGTLAPATNALTAAYLATVDVFYTSLLKTSHGPLSAAEQTALQNWIAGGGTLIVTGDIFPLTAYDSFTAFYGVGKWTKISRNATATTTVVHPITTGVSAYRLVTNGAFTIGSNAMLLGDDGAGNNFMAVLEPSTGFTSGGRIFVIGDHNMFTDSYIANNDNVKLANNIALWACSGCPNASWSNYGAGWPGTAGVPSLAPTANPVIGSTLSIGVQNSSGLATAAGVIVGTTQASLPTPFGGTLLIDPATSFAFTIPVPAAGAFMQIPIPNSATLCGAQVLMQSIQGDNGASLGIAFSQGLSLTLGN